MDMGMGLGMGMCMGMDIGIGMGMSRYHNVSYGGVNSVLSTDVGGP